MSSIKRGRTRAPFCSAGTSEQKKEARAGQRMIEYNRVDCQVLRGQRDAPGCKRKKDKTEEKDQSRPVKNSDPCIDVISIERCLPYHSIGEGKQLRIKGKCIFVNQPNRVKNSNKNKAPVILIYKIYKLFIGLQFIYCFKNESTFRYL